MQLLSLISRRRTATTLSFISSFSYFPSCLAFSLTSRFVPIPISIPIRIQQTYYSTTTTTRLYHQTITNDKDNNDSDNANNIMSTTDDENIIMLQPLSPKEVSLELKDPVNSKALEQAKDILKELTHNGQEGTVNPSNLLKVAQRLGDVDATTCTTPQDLIVSKSACKDAFDNLTDTQRIALTNMYHRIKAFAELQRLSVKDTEMSIPGGKAGHTVSPCRAAGCYAPGGRYPLPSSVLMTCCTARAAGCPIVILASPKPAPITLAAAYIAGADIFVRVGGAQAIATMAYGLTIDGSDNNESETLTTPEETENNNSPDDESPMKKKIKVGTNSSITIPPCDVICGPGNQWVTAAKSIVQGKCGIDMLAGPSEVLVICDETASPSIVAADLLAQAEHDVVARAILLTTSSTMVQEVNIEIYKQVNELPEPNKSTAISALKNGSFSVLCQDMQECISISDNIAPEHLEIQTLDSQDVANQCTNYGGLFIGVGAAEVLGDYGAGPNHTLPTGGTGRYTGGLSVFNFLRIRTWMRIDTPSTTESQTMIDDAVIMARLEGLEGHARAAEKRKL
jgi:histidinol dehydrogenase